MAKYLLRNGRESDRAAIVALMAINSMEADLPPQEFLVVEIEDRLVGLARLEQEEHAVYIRPVLVDAAWQGKGIGRRLVREVSKSLPVVHVVARGEASGFYAALDFAPVSWDQVPLRYRQECMECPDRERCAPVPMALNRKGKSAG